MLSLDVFILLTPKKVLYKMSVNQLTWLKTTEAVTEGGTAYYEPSCMKSTSGTSTFGLDDDEEYQFHCNLKLWKKCAPQSF